MSPEEREKARAQWRKKMETSGGLSTQGGVSGKNRRVRKQAQVNNENEIRLRLVMVKEGEEFKPRFIKTAASNFDNTEIVEGLKEGDEIQITTVSRAKIASEQMTERMRNSNPLSGGGPGRIR